MLALWKDRRGVTAALCRCVVAVFGAVILLVMAPAPSSAEHSVARQWNDALLDAIRIDFPAPTIHARNLYHASVVMWDSWATFDSTTRGIFYTKKTPLPADISAARNEAISYAAYHLLSQRYKYAVDPLGTQAIFDGVMESLGYDTDITTTLGNSPPAIGNRIAARVLASTIDDGSNEANGYVDDTGYSPLNDPMHLQFTYFLDMDEPNHWQPLALESRFTQNGLKAERVQTYVSPNWGDVTPFALQPESGQDPWTAVDPGPPPLLRGVGDVDFKANVLDVIRHGAVLDPRMLKIPFDLSTVGLRAGQSTMIDISPASFGNRVLGSHIDEGYAKNPVTGLPYTPQLVRLGDYGRVIAEFWADGPESETPPGHWFTLANYVADHPDTVKRIGGDGPVVDDLEWDVKVYLALGGGVHDAAIAAWGSKREYDYVRPISMIRQMGGLGQSSDVGHIARYHPDGIPLESGVIEVITSQTTAPGSRHEHLAKFEGEIAIYAWSGEGQVADGEVGGTQWIRAAEWWPYQRSTFVTPPFAAYVSGHSTFSRAAAEVLTEITGSEFFPGGLGEHFFAKEAFLEFEHGPSNDVTLQWATYRDAADEAGISRLFGGIHVACDDFAGRIMGSLIGQGAWVQAQAYFVPTPATGLCLTLLAGLGVLRRPKRQL